MKFLILTLLLLPIVAVAQDGQKASTIYGEDDRQEVSEAAMTDLSLGVAVALPSQYTWKLPVVEAPTLEKRFRICPSDRYASQPSIGSCSALHVGNGLLLTAAHCVATQYDCEKFKWAFNYRSDVIGEVAGTLKMNEVYKCESVVAVDHERDVALIQLEKSAKSQKGHKLSFSPVISPKVFAIGSPMGLPLKFSGYGQLYSSTDESATASIDTFHGNSGSPVFNEDKQVLGLLLSGGNDFVTNDNGCREGVVLDEKEHLETILLISALPDTFRFHIRRAGRKL